MLICCERKTLFVTEDEGETKLTKLFSLGKRQFFFPFAPFSEGGKGYKMTFKVHGRRRAKHASF
jgi:hypothetical protein